MVKLDFIYEVRYDHFSMKFQKDVCIIGTGVMGVAYVDILKKMNITPCVIGNSQNSCDLFFSKTGIKPEIGGYKNVLKNLTSKPKYAIVTTPIELLSDACIELMRMGVSKILCEKPVALSLDVLQSLNKMSKQAGCQIFVAYNRRFYSSVLIAKKMIEEDGGISSVFFDFTEWDTHVNRATNSLVMKKNWIIANSSHVIDMVFSLIGIPRELHGMELMRATPLYIGYGISVNNIPFSYHSDWGGAGRWGVEINTKRAKYIFRPLEKLQIQEKLSMQIKELPIDPIDEKFKPGLYRQVESFLEFGRGLLELQDHLINFEYYLKMNSFTNKE